MSEPLSDDLLRGLPHVLPIFPLEGALLLPHGHLPLHIFEPRYRNMVEHSLGRGRMIGMIQPRSRYPHPIPDDADIFTLGCAGRIVSFSESEDSRFLITLKGVCRFRVIEELPPQCGFRRVMPDYGPFHGDFGALTEEGIDRDRLLDAARAFLKLKAIDCDWNAVQAAPTAALVTAFAMTCPLEPREKQALLECESFLQRAEMLISLFAMAVLESDAQPSHSEH